jgi:hypothetical protein
MAGENPNPSNLPSGLLGNDPANPQPPQGTAGGQGEGGQGLTEADVRRIVEQVAKPLAQSEAYKAENRVNQNVQGQINDIASTIAALQKQNPNLKLSEITPEQIRAAQQDSVIRQIADSILSGQGPQGPTAQPTTTRGQSQGQGGGGQGQMNLTQNDIAYLQLRGEEIFAEEGLVLDEQDPEAQTLDLTGRGQYLVSLRKAVQAKKERFAANPQAQLAPLGAGQAQGLIQQYQTEKAKLPRGEQGHLKRQELKIKYQKLGVDGNQLT